MTPRSYLYVPGNRDDMLTKAAAGQADAIIADLEDGVAPSAKAQARDTVRRWLASAAPGPEIWVRINNDADLMEADIDAAVRPGSVGIYLPKATPETLERAQRLVSNAADRNGVTETVSVIALVESAAGLLAVNEIAAHPGVSRLAIGEADLGGDLGIDPALSDAGWLPIRLQLVVASAAAGIAAPVGPVSTDYTDDTAMRASTLALKRIGFGARAAIHPRQVPVVNQAFTPSAEEIAAAEDLLDRFEGARAAGSGVTLASDGSMVDAATVRHARRVVEQARRTEGQR